MAIVAANVVHAPLICLVCLSDGFVVFLLGHTLQVKHHVLVRLPKCQVVDRHVVRAGEVMGDAPGVSYPGVPNERDDLGQAWKRSPNDREREPRLLWIYSVLGFMLVDELRLHCTMLTRSSGHPALCRHVEGCLGVRSVIILLVVVAALVLGSLGRRDLGSLLLLKSSLLLGADFLH